MGTINLPGGHWQPDSITTDEQVSRANNVLVAAHDADLLIVTFEGVTYRWKRDPEYGELVEDKVDSVDKMDSEIESRFASHPVAGKQAHDIERMRTYFRALAYEVKRLVPPGREQSKALTHLEDGSFDAVSGIARKP
jgi:hypothetical protein